MHKRLPAGIGLRFNKSAQQNRNEAINEAEEDLDETNKEDSDEEASDEDADSNDEDSVDPEDSRQEESYHNDQQAQNEQLGIMTPVQIGESNMWSQHL